MNRTLCSRWCLAFSLVLFAGDGFPLTRGNTDAQPALAPAGKAGPPYEWRADDPEGTGKWYLGREIAQVMGHEGVEWLERPEREAEEKPRLLVETLPLKPGDVVADVGAGSGYLTAMLARKVGESGRVYAVDVQREMLKRLKGNMAEQGLTNVNPILGTVTNANLPPAALDLAIMVDVYHEFSHPWEMMQSICRAIKPGGRVILVEYRAEDPAVPIKRLHKMTEVQVRKELGFQPLEWLETREALPRQHIVIFRKL